MEDQELKALARKIDDLILLCEKLDFENRQLKTRATDWEGEREVLVEKNEIARRKVKSMIVRLKALEQE